MNFNILPFMPGTQLGSGAWQWLDAGSGNASCGGGDPGDDGDCGDSGYCFAGQTGGLPMPGPSVSYCGGTLIANGVFEAPICNPSP